MKKLILAFSLILCINTNAQTDIITTGVPYDSFYMKGYDAHIDKDRNIIVMTRDSFGLKLAKLDSAYNVLWSKKSNNLISPIEHGGGIISLLSGDYIAFQGRDGITNHGHIIKFTTDGDILWDKRVDSTASNCIIYEVIELPNENMIVLCHRSGDEVIICFDTNGNQLWNKVFELPQSDHQISGGDVIVTSDQEILFISRVSVLGIAGNSKVYMTKLDLNGNTIWDNYLAVNSGSEGITSIIESSDNNYYTFGTRSVYNYGADSVDIVVRKYDVDGNYINGKVYGGVYNDKAYDIIECNDGNFILSSMHRPDYNCTPFLCTFYKIEPNLDTIWTKTIGKHDIGGAEFKRLKKMDTLIYCYGHSDVWTHLASRDQALILSNQDFDIPCHEYPSDIFSWNAPSLNPITNDLITFNTVIPFSGNSDWTNAYLTTLNGCTGEVLDSLTYPISDLSNPEVIDVDFLMYPNPNTGQFRLEITNNQFNEIKVLDLNGRIIYQNRDVSELTIDLSYFSVGVYIVEANIDNTIIRKKVIVK